MLERRSPDYHSVAQAGNGFVVNTTNGKVWATNQTDTAYYDESTGLIQ